jgi:hypothetical protein
MHHQVVEDEEEVMAEATFIPGAQQPNGHAQAFAPAI